MKKICKYEIGAKLPCQDKGRWIKVMAIADGYVMARRTGCIPFVLDIEAFEHLIYSENLKR